MKNLKINITLNYFWLSKYLYKSLFEYPTILNLNFNIIIYYKQKYKYFLFMHIIFFLLFFNPNIKSRYFFKLTPVNILQLNLKKQMSIIWFLQTYIYVYFPLIDSFSAELKVSSKNNIIKFSFFKFPLVFELNALFNSLDHLYSFLNNYKFQLEFTLKKRKNNLINYNYLHYLKLPILLN